MDELERITAAEAAKEFGRMLERAARAPMMITKHGRDSYVVIKLEDFEQLVRCGRVAGHTRDAPQWLVDAMANAEPPADNDAYDHEVT